MKKHSAEKTIKALIFTCLLAILVLIVAGCTPASVYKVSFLDTYDQYTAINEVYSTPGQQTSFEITIKAQEGVKLEEVVKFAMSYSPDGTGSINIGKGLRADSETQARVKAEIAKIRAEAVVQTVPDLLNTLTKLGVASMAPTPGPLQALLKLGATALFRGTIVP